MRQLLAGGDDVDVAALYAADARPAPEGRPWLLLDMIATADGATAMGGVTKHLGGEGDRRVFHALRELADVILVGAGTVRAENYGQARMRPGAVEHRAARGQAPAPPIAVVSARLDLDPDARLFTEPGPAPLVVTVEAADSDRRARLAERAEIVVAGETMVDPGRALEELGARGVRVALCEGGPLLNGQLVAAGLVDELCLTIAPCLVVGSSARVAHGPELSEAHGMALDRVLEEEGYLFLRYVRR